MKFLEREKSFIEMKLHLLMMFYSIFRDGEV